MTLAIANPSYIVLFGVFMKVIIPSQFKLEYTILNSLCSLTYLVVCAVCSYITFRYCGEGIL